MKSTFLKFLLGGLFNAILAMVTGVYFFNTYGILQAMMKYLNIIDTID